MALTKIGVSSIKDTFKTTISGSARGELSSSVHLRQVATTISGSLGANAAVIRSLDRTTISGSIPQALATNSSPTFAAGTITGDLSVGGTLTAQEVHTEFESASILFTSGSTRFGDDTTDTHRVTGSMDISGSLNIPHGDLIVTDNIGIGTDSPDSQLHVVAAGSPSIRVTDTTNTVTGKFQADNSVGKVGTQTNHSFELFSNNTTAVTIDASQNVGIGTTTMDAHVNINSGTENAGLHVESTDSNANISMADNAGSVVISAAGNEFIVETGGSASTAGSGASEAIRIDSSGRVGIANDTPGDFDADGDDLVIGNSTGNRGLTVRSSATGYGSMYFAMGTSTTAQKVDGFLVYDHGTSFSGTSGLHIGTGASTRIGIDESGKIGINETAPTATLDVRGSSSQPICSFGDANIRDADATDIFGSDSFRYQFQNGTPSRPAIIEGGGDVDPNESAVYFTGFSSSQDDGHRNLGGMIVFRKNTGGSDAGQYGSQLQFRTKTDGTATPAQRMVLEENGRLGINIGTPIYKLDVHIASATHVARFRNGGDNFNMHGIIISAGKSSPVSAGDCNYIFFQDGGGTSRGGIRNSSTADNPEFFNGSDLRMKKDVAETKVNGLETINAIPLKEWNWNSTKELPKTKIGIVADDLEKVLPELVSKQIDLEGWEHCVKDGEEPLKTIPTETQLTLTLMKAVQELSTEVETLKAQVSGSN
jgi:hypothetical protein